MESTMSSIDATGVCTVAPLPPAADFPVTWQNSDDAHLCWTLDRVHWPDPMAPLAFAIAGEALARGLTAAAQAYERSIVAVRVQRINTYRYQAIIPAAMAADERTAQARRSRDKMDAAMARLGELWRTVWLPEIQAHLTYWESVDLQGASLPALLTHLDETIARAARLWEIHFLLLTPLYRALSRFGTLYRDLFGAESALEAYQLLLGFDNKTLETGRALWQLSRQARAVPRVRAILEEHDASDVMAALAQAPDGLSFLAGLRAYLQEYGQRGDKWSLDAPSWSEDPAPVIKNLRDYLAQTRCDALAERAALAAQRDRLVADTRARLQGYPRPVIEQFEVLLNAAQDATVLSEDHSFWIDFRGMYQARRVFIEYGRRLPRPACSARRRTSFTSPSTNCARQPSHDPRPIGAHSWPRARPRWSTSGPSLHPRCWARRRRTRPLTMR
jgi:pyruvate,water dikinase